MPIPGESVNDFIYSAENLRYSEWKRKFALFPVTTLSKERVWLRYVYKRKRWLLVEPPQFPVNSFKKYEYATAEDLLRLKLGVDLSS